MSNDEASKPSKMRMPALTSWIKRDTPPPAGVMLLIKGHPSPDFGPPEADMVSIGFWSDKTKAFVGEEHFQCIEELYDVDSYHVITNSEGKAIPFWS